MSLKRFALAADGSRYRKTSNQSENLREREEDQEEELKEPERPKTPGEHGPYDQISKAHRSS